MIRNIIKVDADKCNGCGLCAEACHEGAIGIVNGKAKLLRDDYCDGLGNCLPVCPTGAITFEEREAMAFDANAVTTQKPSYKNEEEIMNNAQVHRHEHLQGGCPGSMARALKNSAVDSASNHNDATTEQSTAINYAAPPAMPPSVSELRQWPVQIQLVPVNAPYFNGAKLLAAADCAAYARARFHEEFMRDRVTIIGCPKLDSDDYAEKLTQIIRENNIKSITVVRMEVPCCGGIEQAVISALRQSGKFIPWQVVALSIDGEVLPE